MSVQYKLNRLLKEIERDYHLTAPSTRHESPSPAVVSALLSVPRHEFIPEHKSAYAYDNHPLPIGYAQTISQPFIVALMTDLLKLRRTSKVLEVGTGSGYQTAVLASIASQVYSIERIEDLGVSARQRLEALHFRNIHYQIGDGYLGWPEVSPFDGIIVTACAEQLPPPLIEQLNEHARMVIPLKQFFGQVLSVVRLTHNREPVIEKILPVKFVPLLHA